MVTNKRANFAANAGNLASLEATIPPAALHESLQINEVMGTGPAHTDSSTLLATHL